MKTATNPRKNQIYLATGRDELEEYSQVEKPLSRKIEDIKQSLVEFLDELETLRLTARRMEAFKSLDAVVGEGESDPINMHEMVRRFEIDLICRALEQTGGHQIRAARILGINVTTLNSMIKRYGINPLHFAVGVLDKGGPKNETTSHVQSETTSAVSEQEPGAEDKGNQELSEGVAH